MPLFFGEDKISQVVISVDSADEGVNTNDATLNSGAQMLSGVTAYSKGTKYTGTIATVTGPTPDIAVSDSGLITASVSNPKGYQSSATTKTSTQQLTTQGIKVITPNDSVQTAVSAGVYTTGATTVSAVPTETKSITSNGTYNPTSGKYFSSVTVDVPSETFNTQTKTVTPTESTQTISPDNGYDGLSQITVNPIPSNYVGSGVTTKGTATITPSTSVQTVVSAGTYVTGDIKVAAMTNGELNTPTVSASGFVTASVKTSGYLDTSKTSTLQLTTKGATTITPSTSTQTAITAGTYATGNITVSAMPNGALSELTINESTGLVTGGVTTSGYISNSATKTLQLNTKSAATITPTTTDQTIDAGQYLVGVQTIQGDANLVPENIASGVSIFGVTGTHQGGGGTDTSDATATEADIVNGKTAYINGGKVTGTLVVQNYYTGSTVPESSLGNDGDLYFKV